MITYYNNEEDYLRSLKKNDRYHFTIPFEYIKKRLGNDKYDIAITNMEVDVIWSDTDLGYRIYFNVPNMHLIDPNEGNGDAEEFYTYAVEEKVMAQLKYLGIPSEALYMGTGSDLF